MGLWGFLVISQTLNIVVRLLLIPARTFFALIFFGFVCFVFVFPIILVFKHNPFLRGDSVLIFGFSFVYALGLTFNNFLLNSCSKTSFVTNSHF